MSTRLATPATSGPRNTAPTFVMEIATAHGPVTCPAEIINEHLAIVPETVFGPDGKTLLSGLFNVAHRASGYRVTTSSGCIECARRVGKEISELDINWNAFTGLDEETAAAILALPVEVRRELGLRLDLDWLCDAEYCVDDAEEMA